MSDKYFRGAGGAIIKITVPEDGTNWRELHDRQLANGDLVEVPAGQVEAVTVSKDRVRIDDAWVEVPTVQFVEKAKTAAKAKTEE